MRKRLFVAVNLPDDIKSAISRQIDDWRPLFSNEIRFMPADNWHLTITFLDYQEDEYIPAIVGAMEEVAETSLSADINFTSFAYGPTEKRPRMIWLMGDEMADRWLGDIKNKLEVALIGRGVMFNQERKPPKTHITLARFQDGTRNNLPKIAGVANINFLATGLDLMESTLKRSGAEYDELFSVDFND
ncbi:MAG: RNA 2',3'-cyclic phosphodiesterase [bacterium]|nr:RNA 2',3'-cyclic phosphodiesterase [bacterium]